MIDLHSHILPALCDGSPNRETSLEMARLAVADGTTHLACTPHIYPGVYPNTADSIVPAIAALQAELDAENIPLTLVAGADVHMVPEVMEGLKTGRIPTLHSSRYFLLEPSHHVPVPHFLQQIENFLNAGYVPVITHPERLRWLDEYYVDFISAARMGAWLQLTAGAITGNFGRQARKNSERLLLDGVVHLIASDAHGCKRRRPVLSAGVAEAVCITGDEAEIRRMVQERPQLVLDNGEPDSAPLPAGLTAHVLASANKAYKKGWFQRLFY